MLRDHPDLVNYTRAWTLSEPLISMYNITGLVLKAVPSSRARILHFIGCQEFLDHLMFFRFIPVMNSQVTFLTLQNVTLDTTEFFRLLVATPNLEFLVVSHDLIKQSKQSSFIKKQPRCQLKGLIIRTDNENDDGERLFEVLLHNSGILSILETLLITFHSNWIMGEEMEAVTRIVEGAAETLKHVGFTFKDSSYEDVKQAGMCSPFSASASSLVKSFSRHT